VWDDAPVIAHLEEFLDGFAAVWAIVECALVDVHADKAVGERGVQVARELHRVLERLFAMVEGVLDAVAQGIGGGEEGVDAEGAADGVATEREREVGLLAPPLAEVEELEQAVIRVGELALMDDEACLVFAGDYGGDDLVEGDHHGFDLRCEELEREVGGGEGAGDGDAGFFKLRHRQLAGGDDHGAVALADAAAAGHQGVVVLQVGVGMEADGGNVVEGLVDGAVVEGLDVGEGMGELVAGDSDLVGGEAVEHEGVVRVGAVGDADLLDGSTCCSHGAIDP